MHTLRGHNGWVLSAAFQPEGKLALTGSNDGTARLWDLDFGEVNKEFSDSSNPKSAVMDVAFSGDGSKIILGTGSNSTLVYDFYNSRPQCDADQAPSAMSGAIICRETVRPRSLGLHTGWVVSVAACPDSALAITGSHDGLAGIWNITTGELLNTLGGHGGSVSAVACSSDGKTIMTGGRAGDVHLWDVASGDELLKLDTRNLKRKDRLRFKGGLPDAGTVLAKVDFMPLGTSGLVGFLVPAPPKPIPEDPARAQCLSECAAQGNPPDKVMFPL